MKTLIELFDRVQVENAIAGLRFKPEKIVFIGFDNIMTAKKQESLAKFFAAKAPGIALEFVTVDRYDYEMIVENLNIILDNNEDCCFDLTGGTELVLTAMGAVSALRDVPMFQFNVRTGNFIRIKNCEDMSDAEKSYLTLNESVELNGCSILHNEPDDFSWELSSGFVKDIESIWNICKTNCRLWNKQSDIFKKYEEFGSVDEEYRVTVNLKFLEEQGYTATLSQPIIKRLVKKGLLTEYDPGEVMLSFKYKNKQVHECITKAGNVLELYSYILLREIARETPGHYDDLDIGVYVDWDGVIHDGTTRERDTKNELDIMIMRDLVPVFISCKNGEVPKEALYELSTVAEKFGGKYARKFMLATYVTMDPERLKYLRQRAIDMGITLIYDVHEMTRDKFKNELKRKIV